ncbi:hypothetical protein PMAYCL1PPCAC_11534, partial [Pristionchus mayeri]
KSPAMKPGRSLRREWDYTTWILYVILLCLNVVLKVAEWTLESRTVLTTPLPTIEYLTLRGSQVVFMDVRAKYEVWLKHPLRPLFPRNQWVLETHHIY